MAYGKDRFLEGTRIGGFQESQEEETGDLDKGKKSEKLPEVWKERDKKNKRNEGELDVKR